MIKKYIVFTTAILGLIISVNCQGDNIKTKSIRYYDLDIKLSYNPKNFFTGVISISKNGAELYSIDSTFSDYIGHDEMDLNSDGSKELLLYCSGGASPYIFQDLYFFDIKRSEKPVYMIQNGYLDTTTSKHGRILVNQRLSPAVMGLWYSWFLEYKDNKLVLPKLDKKSKNQLAPDLKSITENLDVYFKNGDACDDYNYKVFFENVFICNKITGNDEDSEEYFYKNYKCDNKLETLEYLIKLANDTYSYLKDDKNYLY